MGNTTLQIFETQASPSHSNKNFNKQAEQIPLPDTPVFTKNINKEARKNSLISLASVNQDRKDSVMTMDLINAPILENELSVLEDIESLSFDDDADVKGVKKTSQETIPVNTGNEGFTQKAWASNVQILNGQNDQSQNIPNSSVEPHGPSSISLYR